MFKLRGMDFATLYQAAWTGIRVPPKPRYVFICIADHFEPDWRNASRTLQNERVQRWVNEFGPLFSNFEDSRGRSPQHSFFYPIEVYDELHIAQLCKLVRAGHGDIEIHLHHDNDTSSRLAELLEQSRDRLHERHGLLSRDADGKLRYGFIHGNWALDNSHPDGKWCGVNDELNVLMRTGCYADFTMPAAPHPAQTRTINSIYYATDDPKCPKSHDRGTIASVGNSAPDNSLLMVQGPLLLTISSKSGIPKLRVENGNLAGGQPPSNSRILRWLQAGVTVSGRPDWVFIKLHTHGAQEDNMTILLGESMQQMHQSLRQLSESNGFQYFYVTAREMAQLVHQAETGVETVDFANLCW